MREWSRTKVLPCLAFSLIAVTFSASANPLWPTSPLSRNIPAPPAARRPNGILRSRRWSAGSAAPSRRSPSTRQVRSGSWISPRRFATCPTKTAAGWRRSARSSARAARRCRSSIRSASGRTATSAARRRWCPTTRSRRRSGRRACCRSRSPTSRCASRSAGGTARSGWRRTRSRRRALVDRVHGVYIPYWTFDAHVVCPWRAEAGHYYYTTETLPRQPGPPADAAGAPRALGAGVGRGPALLRRRAGARDAGRFESLLKEVEPFPTAELVPYSTGYLSGFVVEHYQVVLLEAARVLADADDAASSTTCAPQQVPGDTHRNLEIFPTFSGRTFKHVLVPVWLLTYTYGNKPWQVVVNGYTGRMAGRVSEEPVEDRGLVLVILIVVLVVADAESGVSRTVAGLTATSGSMQPSGSRDRDWSPTMFNKTTHAVERRRAARARRERCRCRTTHFVNGAPLEAPFPGGPRAGDVRPGCFWGAERSSGSCRASTRPPSATPPATRRTRPTAKSAAA